MNPTIIAFIANVGTNDEKAEELGSNLADQISHKSLTLIDLVVALKEQFTSEDENTRKNALRCLSLVLSKLPADLLLVNEISVLIAFYESKAYEELLMQDVLQGFDCLAQMNRIVKQDVATIIDTLGTRYDPTNYLTPTRYTAFKLINNLFDKFEEMLIEDGKLAESYIKAFIHVAMGEKDPRNLLISFRLNRSVALKLSRTAEKYKEDLFDVLFCYFPITFKPPKNDPYKITTADLKGALRNAISSSPFFAEDAFSNLIDKLAASSPIVKNDTLLTLKACIQQFGGEACLKQWLPLWNALKFELLHNAEGGDVGLAALPSVESNAETPSEINNYQAVLDIMRTMTSALISYDKNAFQKFYMHIFENLKMNFTYEKDLKQTCSILSAIASSNAYAFDEVIKRTLPLFLKTTSELPKLKTLIMNLSFFLDSYIEVFGTTTEETAAKGPSPPPNALNQFKDEILMILSIALTGSSKVEVTIRTLSIIQFTKLVKMAGYLKKEEIALIVQYLAETILSDNNRNIYYACLEGLKIISGLYQDIVFDVSLKRMLMLLPDKPSQEITLNDHEPVEAESILKVILDYTTSVHYLVKESIFSLSEKLSVVAKHEGSETYCFLLISTLYSIFENNFNTIEATFADEIKDRIQLQLFDTIMSNDSILEDDHNLTLASAVLFFTNLETTITDHQDQLHFWHNKFTKEYNIFERPSRAIIPFVKVLSSIDKDAKYDNAKKDITMTISLLRAQSEMPSLQKMGYLELLMILSNKWLDENDIKPALDWPDTSAINLEIIAWINKGLLMKNSPVATLMLTRFTELLNDKDIGRLVAKLFEVLVIDINSFQHFKGISWNNNVKLLHKQKFCNDVFQPLVDSYQKATDLSTKSNYLTALSMILIHTPNTLIKPFMHDLFPILLQALEMPNAQVKTSALETLRDTADKNAELITEHLHTLVPLLTKLAQQGKSNTAQVRLCALQVLETFITVIPPSQCVQVRDQVLTTLKPVLDDPKRIIRKQCVDTSQAYFELQTQAI